MIHVDTRVFSQLDEHELNYVVDPTLRTARIGLIRPVRGIEQLALQDDPESERIITRLKTERGKQR